MFALSRWLAVTLPVEYYEFARGLQWSIPYFSLPWETGGIHPIMLGSNASAASHSYISSIHDSENSPSLQFQENKAARGSPLWEYISLLKVGIHSLYDSIFYLLFSTSNRCSIYFK